MPLHNPRASVLIYEERLNHATKGKPKIEQSNEMRFDSFANESLFVRVNVELTSDKASQAEFTVFDEDYSFMDLYTRDDGVEPCAANFYLGYGEDLGQPVFEGLLAAVEHHEGETTLFFYDRSVRMRLEEKSGYHKGLDTDVMRQLAERNGLNFVLLDKTVKGLPLKSRIQGAETDWDFLTNLTQEAGLVTYVRGSTIYAARKARIGEPALTLDKADALILRGERIRYEMPENVEGSPASVEVRGTGAGGARASGFSAQMKRGRKKLVLNGITGRENATSEAKRRAQAIKDLEDEPSFSCQVRTLFHPDTRRAEVRQTVWLINRGELFSGLYIVDSLNMEFEPGNLTIDYELVRSILICKELLALPNAESIYPDAVRRCKERSQKR